MTAVKKTRWLKTVVLVLVACGIAGILLAAIMFSRNPGKTYASALLQFSFNGAGEGLAPSGYPFDVNGIYSEEVLANALASSGVSDTYTTDQIRENLTVTGIYPENIVSEMTSYDSLLNADADNRVSVSHYHATEYSVVLNHDFDPKISGDRLTGLLNDILDVYREYFLKTSTISLEQTDPVDEDTAYDYSQQLLAIRNSVNQQSRFAQEMADREADFRVNDKGFGDLSISYLMLESEIDRLDASVALNHVSKNGDRLWHQYEMETRRLSREREALQDEIRRLEKLISDYEKDGIVYISTSNALQKVAGDASETYDQLIMKRQELTDQLTVVKADIAEYQELLNDRKGGSEAAGAERTEETEETEAAETGNMSTKRTEEEQKAVVAVVEKQLEQLNAKKEKISNEFSAMLEAYAAQEINERTVQTGSLRYKAPSLLSMEFAVQAVKAAACFCFVGLMGCAVWMIIRRWKEEADK